VPEVGPVALNTSSRVMVIFTGLPVFFDMIAASGSRYMPSLPPKPPPISTAIQVMFETGMPNTRARTLRPAHGAWVLAQTVSVPSAFQFATAFCGSM